MGHGYIVGRIKQPLYPHNIDHTLVYHSNVTCLRRIYIDVFNRQLQECYKRYTVLPIAPVIHCSARILQTYSTLAHTRIHLLHA